MKKLLKLFMLIHVVVAISTACNDEQEVSKSESIIEEGAIKKSFSISETDKVYFSQGNLQFQASTGLWRFAENQYDIIGFENENISSTNNGWIDLFGWGTSGWDSGCEAFQPYSINTIISDYCPGNDPDNNLTDNYANADWGVYNKISNGGNKVELWRTLTADEWSYLFKERQNSKILYSRGSIDGINGLILLPDDWEQPKSVDFSPQGDDWRTNEYTVKEWSKMEANGAVFLPAAGNRLGTEVNIVNSDGYYWSTTTEGDEALHSVRCIGFNKNGVMTDIVFDRQWGLSVRLVKNVK